MVTTTPAALMAAILAEFSAEFSARGLPLGYCGEIEDPASLKDANGLLALPMPVLAIEAGPCSLITDDEWLDGSACDETLVIFRAFAIAGVQHDHQHAYTWRMTTLARAILRKTETDPERGNRFGLGDALHVPKPDISDEPADLEMPGYACRVLTWQQAARFVDDYT